MRAFIRSEIVKICEGYWLHIPDRLVEQLGLRGKVALRVQGSEIILRRAARAGWAEKFKRMAELGEDKLLDGDIIGLSSWDNQEWEWSRDDVHRGGKS